LGILAYSPLLHGLLTGKFASADEVPEGRARTRHFSRTRARTRHGQPGFEAETFATIDRIRHISQGIGRPMAQVAIAWVLYQRNVTSVIVGARKPAQLEENLKALQLRLSAQALRELDEATADLKQKLGPNPDLWQSQSRFR
jgi:aryl-alcohol dehydrogenase-like predicted oxidoreductase